MTSPQIGTYRKMRIEKTFIKLTMSNITKRKGEIHTKINAFLHLLIFAMCGALRFRITMFTGKTTINCALK